MPFLSMVRRAAVETRSLTQRFSEATQKRRSWRFGWKRRRVLRLECETLLPVVVRLPVTWQTLDTGHLDGVVDGFRSPETGGPAAARPATGGAAGRSEPRIMLGNSFTGKYLVAAPTGATGGTRRAAANARHDGFPGFPAGGAAERHGRKGSPQPPARARTGIRAADCESARVFRPFAARNPALRPPCRRAP